MKEKLAVFLIILGFIIPSFGDMNEIMAQTSPGFYSSLKDGQVVSGFRTLAVYLNDTGAPMGGRFRHLASGFTVDLLEIQTVPQGLIWVRSFPVSDRGEPHTQEHLLLGKG